MSLYIAREPYVTITPMDSKSARLKKTKIIYLITKGNWGGAQRYVFDLATSLPQELFDVAVAIGEGEILENKLKEAGIRTIRIESLQRDINIFHDIAVFFSIMKLLRAECPDVLHVNSSKAGGLGALAGRLCGTPKIIFTGHGWAWNEERSFISKSLITLIHWITIILSHTTIAVAENVKQQIDHLPLVSGKIEVVHNGIGPIKFLDRNEARRTLCIESKEKLWIGAISELHKNKGLDFLIEAFANISKENQDIALIIIGDGEKRKGLTDLAEKLGIKDKTFFLGFIPNASVYLKAFDIFTLTSRTEAFPYAILEAGLAQTPIIASAVGGIPEAVKNGETGILIKRGDIAALKEGVNILINNSTKAAEFSQAMRKDVEQVFSLSVMVKNTMAIYNK